MKLGQRRYCNALKELPLPPELIIHISEQSCPVIDTKIRKFEDEYNQDVYLIEYITNAQNLGAQAWFDTTFFISSEELERYIDQDYIITLAPHSRKVYNSYISYATVDVHVLFPDGKPLTLYATKKSEEK